ncbi:hypothetical protein EDB83DRAFT_2538196 [Lactarius deliciosus]|nr:hypothetical protein EDB83DRAFT_2538196 [Lactarius deliciosus]
MAFNVQTDGKLKDIHFLVTNISGLTRTRTRTRVKPVPVLTGMGTDRSALQDTVLQSPPSPPPSVASSPSSSSSLSSLQSSPSLSLQLLLIAVVVAIVAAVTVVVVESLVELEWQQGRRLAITPATAVMGATAIAFGTCVAMILAVGHSAGAGEVVVMSRHLRKSSTPGDAGFVLFALLSVTFLLDVSIRLGLGTGLLSIRVGCLQYPVGNS